MVFANNNLKYNKKIVLLDESFNINVPRPFYINFL